jgi:hypothetical protein
MKFPDVINDVSLNMYHGMGEVVQEGSYLVLFHSVHLFGKENCEGVGGLVMAEIAYCQCFAEQI